MGSAGWVAEGNRGTSSALDILLYGTMRAVDAKRINALGGPCGGRKYTDQYGLQVISCVEF